MNTRFLATITDTLLVRKIADAAQLRLAHRRVAELDRLDTARTQQNSLLRMVRYARHTKFGKDHDFAGVRSVADYQDRVPLQDYEYFWNTYWKDAYPRLDNLTWPGFTPYYALSSGTTSGTTKYIPVTKAMVKSNAKAAFTTLSFFRHAHPESQLLTGQFFFLGGSTELRKQDDGSLAGDLSGIAAREVTDALRPYCFPPYNLSTMSDWEVKVQKLAEASVNRPITALSGVPSWMLILFDRLKQATGKKTIAEIWPQLRLVIHGGTKFDSYRDLFRQEIGSDKVHFCEVYPCSEGFIATEDPRYKLLRIVPDHDCVFEFIPFEDFDSHGKLKPHHARHLVGDVEIGVRYAIAITSCGGVWSYLVGDTVTFESKEPPLIRFTGRTKNFLSAFGEHLIEEEVEKAIAKACVESGVTTTDFHVGPVFPTDPKQPGHHLYLVEFRDKVPADLTAFAKIIDKELDRLNEDYAAHRIGDLTMRVPVVQAVPAGGFAAWMKSRGKYGGQNKVPRMDNNGTMTKDIEKWMRESR
ncbi:GH3 auxin-responsive promoter family protein [soil metagenome]